MPPPADGREPIPFDVDIRRMDVRPRSRTTDWGRATKHPSQPVAVIGALHGGEEGGCFTRTQVEAHSLVAVGPAEVSGTMRDAWIVPQLAPVAFPDGTSGSPSSVSP